MEDLQQQKNDLGTFLYELMEACIALYESSEESFLTQSEGLRN